MVSPPGLNSFQPFSSPVGSVGGWVVSVVVPVVVPEVSVSSLPQPTSPRGNSSAAASCPTARLLHGACFLIMAPMVHGRERGASMPFGGRGRDACETARRGETPARTPPSRVERRYRL